ncbi:MAG: response regulator [Candidatus Caenarcaniphilales bacterium]|nr:response regulator [Candidatus Caenarcaniphilales bacterium]
MSHTILVADDEPSLRLLVKATLASRKYTIIEVSNGQDALNLAKQVNPDVILLDVMMPFLTGFQVCAELKKDAKTASVPVIILTAKGGQDDKEMAHSVGASHFLNKPFRPPDLLSAIDYVLSLSAKK